MPITRFTVTDPTDRFFILYDGLTPHATLEPGTYPATWATDDEDNHTEGTGTVTVFAHDDGAGLPALSVQPDDDADTVPRLVPRYPEGTPEHAAYRARLTVELAKFARGETPYEFPGAE